MIHETCRQRRKELKLKQGELAEMLGVRQATISDFECGKHSIGSKTLDKIFKALDIQINT